MREAGRAQAWHRALECAAVVAAAALLAVLFARLLAALDGAGDWLAFALAACAGYLAADAVSGAVHWAFDRLLDEHTPYVGPHFVRPFREHHADPGEITRHDFVELNGNTCIATVPLLAFALAAFEPGTAGAGAVFAAAGAGFVAAWTIGTNQFHQWAHLARAPRAVRALQRWGVVLAPEHHALHHRAPFDVRFCITSGRLNAWADRVRLWGRLEARIRRAAGARRRWAK